MLRSMAMPALRTLTGFRMCAAGGAGGSTTFEALQKADAMWYKLRHAKVGQMSDTP
jgi:hypothetical protein